MKTITDPSHILFDNYHFEKSCNTKQKYDTYFQACYDIEFLEKKHKVKLSTYQCPYCGYWHLTEIT